MKMNNIIFCIILLNCFSSCTPKNFQITSVTLGSDLNNFGEISNNSLVYQFKKEHKGNKVKDLFNYIYFEGDTLCFSFQVNKQVNYNSLKVSFYDPRTGKSFPAERVDLNDETISGFSLVGSVLEKFHEENLYKNLIEEKYFNKKIDFIIKLSITYNDKNIEKNAPGSFRLEYK